MYNESTSNECASHLQSELAQQTETLSRKIEETRARKRYRIQKELELQTEALDHILQEITLLNHHLEKIEESLCSMQKTEPTPRNPLNILEKFEFDGDKLLDTLKILFDLNQEHKNVNRHEEASVDKEVLNRILEEITFLKNKMNMNPLPHMGQPIQNPLNILNNFDIEKILSIVSIFSHLYKVKTNKDENEDMNQGNS